MRKPVRYTKPDGKGLYRVVGFLRAFYENSFIRAIKNHTRSKRRNFDGTLRG